MLALKSFPCYKDAMRRFAGLAYFFVVSPVFALSPLANVTAPVADVWSTPDAQRHTDDQRETQVLYGEGVQIFESSGAWTRVDVMDQPEFTHRQRWEGYPGWVATSALGPRKESRSDAYVRIPWLVRDHTVFPLGAILALRGGRDLRLIALGPGNRAEILATALRFQGVPYLWGGLSAGLPPQPLTYTAAPSHFGVDCSGLVHLSYRANGLTVPRDAHEQWIKAQPIHRRDLQPADLIFSAKADDPQKMTHVALYAGHGEIVEAPQTGLAVRKIPFEQKYGQPLARTESGDRVGERVIYFGRLFPR